MKLRGGSSRLLDTIATAVQDRGGGTCRSDSTNTREPHMCTNHAQGVFATIHTEPRQSMRRRNPMKEGRERGVPIQLTRQRCAVEYELRRDGPSERDLPSICAVALLVRDADGPCVERRADAHANALFRPRRRNPLQGCPNLTESSPVRIVMYFNPGTANKHPQHVFGVHVKAAAPVTRAPQA